MASGGPEPRVGKRIAAARRRRGWSKEALAFHSGLSWAAISQIESGRRLNPRLDTLTALAEALEVSTDYLTGGGGRRPMLRHHALIYDDADQLTEAIVPFLGEGVREAEASLAILTPEKIEVVRERLGKDAREIRFAEAEDWYSSPKAAVASARDFITSALESGAAWARMVGEIPWSSRSVTDIRWWARYEALLNLVFGATPATVVCAYDASGLPAEIITNARCTHSHTLAGEGAEPSAAYEDPGEFSLDE